MAEILVADDEPNIRRLLGSLLRAEGYQVREASGGAAAVAMVRDGEPDAVLLDLYMPGGDGLDALPEMLKLAPDLPVVMMSGRASMSDAVRATKLGAHHFIEKPLTPEAVLLTLRSAVELRQAREMNRSLREALAGEEGWEMVGRSPAIEAVRDTIRKVAPTDARVLITGESGTGKELAATALHRLSARRDGPLVRVNCAAIPGELIESELFGHERGAFTGATERRLGRFELADGGTLFLDEVGDLSSAAQAKLLRALEAGEIERVGGNAPIPVDVRLLSATNKDLDAAVRDGHFRADLLFRLLVIPLHLPPLRERAGDVPLLAAHLLERLRGRTGLRPPQLAPEAIELLARHTWPGNIRELANVLERITILHPGTEIGVAAVASVLAGSPAGAALEHGFRSGDQRPIGERLESYERDLIQCALAAAGGSVTEAARLLATDRANLHRRMRRLSVQR